MTLEFDIDRYRVLLESKRDELLNSTPVRSSASAPGIRTGDWIDQSSQESDVHIHLALKQTDSKLLRAIEEALGRLSAGTYGVCQDCEGLISPARLEAVPWTRVCIQCKERQSES